MVVQREVTGCELTHFTLRPVAHGSCSAAGGGRGGGEEGEQSQSGLAVQRTTSI